MNKCVEDFVNKNFNWYEKLGLKYHKPIDSELKCLEKYDDEDPLLLDILVDQDTFTLKYLNKIRKIVIISLFIIPIISLIGVYFNLLILFFGIYLLRINKTMRSATISRGIMYNIAQDMKETKMKKIYGDNYTVNDEIKTPSNIFLTD